MARYLFSSHDGFGLGHVRRNALIAQALLAEDPGAEITLVTGAARQPRWLGDERIRVVRVPPLMKDSDGAYRNIDLGFDQALARRAVIFLDEVRVTRPDVIVVDRHPYGTAGELRSGLELAVDQGAGLVLGLRDILDEPAQVRTELSGQGWEGMSDLFSSVLVYGESALCDHRKEYGLPVEPRYCGWVVEPVVMGSRDESLVVVSAGGGGDGDRVYALAGELAALLPERRLLVTAGPYAGDTMPVSDRLTVIRNVAGCGPFFAGAGAVVEMAGYNSTVESLGAGVRPVLVPRRSPRREQAIRAGRLAALGLADVVDECAPAEEVAWLLARPRLLVPGAVASCGLRLDGAQRAASHLAELVRAGAR